MLVAAAISYAKKRKAARERAEAAQAAASAEAAEQGEDTPPQSQAQSQPGPSRPPRPPAITRSSRASNISFKDQDGVRSRYRPVEQSPHEHDDHSVRGPALHPPESGASSAVSPTSRGLLSPASAECNGYPGGNEKRHFPHTLSSNTTTSKTSGSRSGIQLRGGTHRKRLAHIPFLRRPSNRDDLSEDDNVWVEEEHEAVEWLSLFYDLVVVAVLTVFSSAHELTTPEAIPIFLSYFILLSWCWTSQTYYDVRYQCEDVYHRLCKACQIACFVYMGAASGRWDPGNVGTTQGLDEYDAEQTNESNESFQTVVYAFIGLRVILAVQYGVCALLAHNVNRPEKRGLLAQVALNFLCVIIAIIAAALPFNPGMGSAKVACFYLSMGLEMAAVWVYAPLRLHARMDPGKVANRYAAFTLIILGEGFIGLTKSFNNAISGFSANNANVYAQVFMIIMTIFCLYLFLFSRFSSEDEISEQRVFLWQIVHFPLHFALLLLLAGMVNVVINISFDQGIGTVVAQFNATVTALANNQDLNSTFLNSLGTNLDKLSLYPQWSTELDTLQSLANMPLAEQPYDPILLSLQYFGQVIVQVSGSYGVDLGDDTREALNELYALNVTSSHNETEQNIRIQEAIGIFLEVGSGEWGGSLSGVLWLFPAAGGVLILCCIRSICWYKYEGIAHWLIHGSQIVAGICLALLGLLDIGNQNVVVKESGGTDPLNPMYYLLQIRIPIAIIASTYFLTYFVPLWTLMCLQAWKGGNIFPNEETIIEEERKKHEEMHALGGHGEARAHGEERAEEKYVGA